MWLVTALLLTCTTGKAGADEQAHLVSSKMIWNQAVSDIESDVVRFKDHWLIVCCESTDLPYHQALRILTSEDSEQWRPVALITSPTNTGLRRPRFSLAPSGLLMLTAECALPDRSHHLARNTAAWFSEEGRAWSTPEGIGQEEFPFSRIVWNNKVGLSYAYGRICGSAQTIQFFSSANGGQFKSQFKGGFSGFFPDRASLLFEGDRAYCLMSRINGANPETMWQNSWLGASQAPFTDWKWKETNARACCPNLLRLPDDRVIAAVGLTGEKARTSLCDIDLATGQLTELLKLPTGETLAPVGLATHDGHLWVSYAAVCERKLCVNLAKVKLNT